MAAFGRVEISEIWRFQGQFARKLQIGAKTRERGPKIPTYRSTDLRSFAIGGPSSAASFSRPRFSRRYDCSLTGRCFGNLAIPQRGKFGRGSQAANPQPTTERAARAGRTRGRRPQTAAPSGRSPGLRYSAWVSVKASVRIKAWVRDKASVRVQGRVRVKARLLIYPSRT